MARWYGLKSRASSRTATAGEANTSPSCRTCVASTRTISRAPAPCSGAPPLLERATGKVGGRDVVTYVDARAIQGYGRKTAVTREAGRKRRLYGTLLGWTGTLKLCGQVAKRQVAATLEHLAGRAVWLDPTRGAGEVRALVGEKVPGGPLDHAGAIARDPARPNAGFVEFVVEVKNVRQTLYPEHREIYDLLWKAGHFPDHVPILIAPKIHHTTFVLFKAIGALAYTPDRQSFAGPPAITLERFRQVARGLAIPHMQQLDDPGRPSRAMTGWFTKTIHGPSSAVDGMSLLEGSEKLWGRAAPILAQPEFEELRKQLDYRPTHGALPLPPRGAAQRGLRGRAAAAAPPAR